MLALSLTLAAAVQALSAQSHPTPELAPQTREATIGDAVIVPIGALDDAIPLPVPEAWRETRAGDVPVERASGDPFFLGFAAGPHRPPKNERIDPELLQIAASSAQDGRPADETYAFVMFAKRITAPRVAALESQGARVLGFHPFYTLKIALRRDAIDAVAGLDFVRWVGVEKSWQKLHPHLTDALANGASGELALWVDVFDSDLIGASTSQPIGVVNESDGDATLPGNVAARARVWLSNGWQQAALEALGAEVGEYVDELRAFRVKLDAAAVEDLVALDFVQFVELDRPPVLHHDESMPTINADRTRVSYDGATNLAARAGLIDSGLQTSHNALDPLAVGWDFTTDGTTAFDDGDGHGSHVGGTILGNGDIDPALQGVAPGLGFDASHRFFVSKVFNSAGSPSGVSFPSVYAQMRASYTDGSGNVSGRPMVINNSYGTPPGPTPYVGTEVYPRLVDDTVYKYDQLYVFSAGNSGSGAGTIDDFATAKNALTVGAVSDYRIGTNDPGTIVGFSSRGPCGDNRWKPNVCAPGEWITSCNAFSASGYVEKNGTSMASPHVTGIAAQLCDHYSFLRNNPATLSAALMAGAITKDNVTLAAPSISSTNHLNVYGTGRVDAYKAQFGDGQQALYFWSFDQTSAGYGQLDFTISPGATRLTVVMHYKEPQTSAGASASLINDLDTWIDVAPFAAGGNTGDYTTQQSSRDNTEIRILNNPTVADWRIKVYPDSVVPGQICKVGVCAIVTYGDTTPNPTFTLTPSDVYLKPNENCVLTASYTNPESIASAVYVDSTSSGDQLLAARTTLEDGSVVDLIGNMQLGRDVLLGDVLHGTNRYIAWTTRWATEGIKTWSADARSDNALDKGITQQIVVDGTPPPLPTNLVSTNHAPNVWSNNSSIAFQWTEPLDNLAGIDGYSWTLAAASGVPDTVKDIGTVTTLSTTLPGFSGSFYLNLRPVDASDNWNAGARSIGPFLLDKVQPAYVTGLHSTSHTAGSTSCSSSVTMAWDPTLDSGGSGLAGYSFSIDHVASNAPSDFVVDIGNVTGVTLTMPPDAQPWYFHISPIDNAGNVQNFFNAGPFRIVSPIPTTYCTAKTNSIGCVPAIGSSGAPSKSANNFTVRCTNVLNNKSGLLFWGSAASATPFQGGTKCVASPTVRSPISASGGSSSGNDCSGTYAFTFDTAYMSSRGIDPGESVYAQWWTRDPASASTTGLSNAIQFTVCE